MVISERGHHVHQANGRFFYAGLNADRLHKYDAACVFHCINQDTIPTNLSRDKVEIVIQFQAPFETNRPRARSATGVNQLR